VLVKRVNQIRIQPQMSLVLENFFNAVIYHRWRVSHLSVLSILELSGCEVMTMFLSGGYVIVL